MEIYPNKIKRFIQFRIPVYACNFRCSYCYVGLHQDAYKNGIRTLRYTPEYIAKFFSLERCGGVCYFNLCADGETTLYPDLIPVVNALTKEGHFIDIITNGTISNRFNELLATLNDSQKSRVFIKFSFHYLELKKRNLMGDFISNVNKIKAAKIAYTIEITPHDELIPYIDELKEFSLKNFGALPHITVARNEATKGIELLTKYSREEYKKIWSVFDSELFNFKLSIFNIKRNEFCYAGLWSLCVNAENGNYSQCYSGGGLGNMDDIYKPINFSPIGKCVLPHCFNGHGFLCWGLIPEFDAPTFGQVRDRVTDNGNHFLSNNVMEFFNSKLKDSSRLLSEKEKSRILHRRNSKIHKMKNIFQRGIKKILYVCNRIMRRTVV